jgi:transposase
MAFLLRDVPTSPPNTTGLPLGPMASLAARARGESANQRLHARWAGFDHRRKHPVVANAAIARELAGWCWSLAVLDD